jgi:hypothetical protein
MLALVIIATLLLTPARTPKLPIAVSVILNAKITVFALKMNV